MSIINMSKHPLRRLTGNYEHDQTIHLATRATESTILQKLMNGNESGISPMSVILIIGSLFFMWLIMIFVGVMCKYFNKPRSSLHSGAYATGGLYRPSAAVYGDKSRLGPRASDPRKVFDSKAALLSGASPMGRAGSPGDSPDVSISRDNFDLSPLPASRHAGPPGQQHPYMIAGPSAAPDGSHYQPGRLYSAPQQHNGFQPGQTFAYPPGPSGTRVGQQIGGGILQPNSRMMRGPPPARSNSKRKSRYATPARVDSLGPGEIRRFMDEAGWSRDEDIEDGQDPSAVNYSRRSINMRRSHSGQPRDSSFAAGKNIRSPSIYGAAEIMAIKTAQAEGFGGGPRGGLQSLNDPPHRVDPLGVSQQRGINVGPNQPVRRPEQQYQVRPGGAAPPPSAYGQAPGPILQSRPPPPAQYLQQQMPQGSGGPRAGMRYPTGPSQLQGPPRPQQQWLPLSNQQGQGGPRGPSPYRGPPAPGSYRQPQPAQGGSIRQIL